MSDEFTNINIDYEDPFQNQIAGRDIVQLKNNIIPKGLVPLEKLFDENDVARNLRIIANDEHVEVIRIIFSTK
jgi:hypothetical protein